MLAVRGLLTCVLLLASSAQHLATCAGWSHSAQARMACCERRACDTPVMADACCAAGEQDENAAPAVVFAAPASTQVAVPMRLGAAPLLSALPSPTLTSPASSRHSVLLI